MPHEFLSSMRSPIFASIEPSEPPNLESSSRPPRKRRRALLEEGNRHRTVGISMSPQLRELAASRAEALGLPLSRYVQWCIESELEGRPPQARFERTG